MYALVLSDNIFTSSFLSRGLKYENVQSVPFAFHHFNLSSININEFDCTVVKIDQKTDREIKLILSILDAIPNKPLYLIKSDNIDLQINKKNIIVNTCKISMRQIAYDMKRRINRAITKNTEKKLRVADLSLDLQRRIATRFDKKFTLRNKEFHLLEFLMHNTELILNRQKILEQVWDRNADMFTNTVDVHINILRRKLDHKDNFRLIETIYCNGYIMHNKPFK